MSKLRVAVVQTTSSNSVVANEKMILDALHMTMKQSLDAVFFPENVWFFRLNETEALPDFTQAEQFQNQVQSWVEANSCAVVLGSVSIRVGNSAKPVAGTVVFEPGQKWRVVYAKIHLFDVDVVGHKPVRESDLMTPGVEASIWRFRGWSFGCAICYDVRFAELFSIYANQEVDGILLPSAFLVPTGRQHWEILIRARAIESQVYMLATAQGGDHEDQLGHGFAARKTYGRSMVVDPWGKIVCAGQTEKSGVEILVAELSKEDIVKVRSQIPMRLHRKLVLSGRKSTAVE